MARIKADRPQPPISPCTGSIEMICGDCHLEKKAARLPAGWKRQEDRLYCRGCWEKRYLLRAITMPVIEPLSGTWQELRAALKEMWAQSTAASNWMLTELYARDARRDGRDKMPAMARVYLYPEARQRFSGLPAQSVAALERAIQRKYRAKRYEVVWTCGAALPSCRYPQPFPVHNQSWSVYFDDDDRPVVSARIGDKRWEMRLKGGIRYRRQLAAVRQMVDGEAVRGEAAFLRRADGTILCKMVAWLPRGANHAEHEGVLIVRTAEDHLLSAYDVKDERIWRYNGDHLRRWIAEYDRLRQRLSQDQKAEQRPTPSFGDRRDAMTRKQRNRINSAVQEIAAHLANFAQRHRFAVVQYDDSENGFVPLFPYFDLRERLRTKLDEQGIAFEHASGQVMQEKHAPLAGEETLCEPPSYWRFQF